uniref:Uncharacterized protein n=1 Tax=Siphoviridae sp. ct0D87 TaxID=2827760 RepID=A0A8S5SAH3_9CAUD|nr:MAG TPA: hypothetical protein [Siphoviridae sp. ct0D87]
MSNKCQKKEVFQPLNSHLDTFLFHCFFLVVKLRYTSILHHTCSLFF